VTEAVIGFVGVIVGGAISGGVAYLLARRNERALARASARLLAENLRSRTRTIEARIALGEEDPSRARFDDLTTPLWDDHQPQLAEKLSWADWEAIRAGYEGVEALRQSTSAEMSFAEVKSVFNAVHPSLLNGIEVLRRLGGAPQRLT
jgi:hypothetical protein